MHIAQEKGFVERKYRTTLRFTGLAQRVKYLQSIRKMIQKKPEEKNNIFVLSLIPTYDVQQVCLLTNESMSC